MPLVGCRDLDGGTQPANPWRRIYVRDVTPRVPARQLSGSAYGTRHGADPAAPGWGFPFAFDGVVPPLAARRNTGAMGSRSSRCAQDTPQLVGTGGRRQARPPATGSAGNLQPARDAAERVGQNEGHQDHRDHRRHRTHRSLDRIGWPCDLCLAESPAAVARTARSQGPGLRRNRYSL